MTGRRFSEVERHAVAKPKQSVSLPASGREHWELWGPYLSERQWGTVREDYSANGDAWTFFPTITPGPGFTVGARMDYWVSATTTAACGFTPTFWNGHDPILKERPFGLSESPGQPR